MQEKFRQAGENLEALNDWLNKVEKEIARQEVLSEDVESLKTQISAMKLIKTDVDDHNRPVNNTLDIIAELVETGADVLSSSELNQLQSEGKQLKERYEHVQGRLQMMKYRMHIKHVSFLRWNDLCLLLQHLRNTFLLYNPFVISYKPHFFLR